MRLASIKRWEVRFMGGGIDPNTIEIKIAPNHSMCYLVKCLGKSHDGDVSLTIRLLI